ncbi:MAG: flagellar basal-body rod protein FlgF [Parvibaculaceae bacterium]|nr:flagellar basal-body rod protein FlgF [Parvibaculaceae bacterium]
MENSLLIGLSRQMTLRREMDVIANNLANMNTIGYKEETPVFEEFIMPTAKQDSADSTLSFVNDIGMYRNMADGGLTTTDNALDFALSGAGYFQVENEDGTFYTRNGHFQLNAQGQLSTPNGDLVLSDGGAPISFTADDGAIVVASDGTISTDNGQRGKLAIVTFENPREMRKIGSNLLQTGEEGQPAKATAVVQGALEASNVNAIEQMTSMIEVLRSYTSANKMIETAEDMKRKAISTIAGQQS